MDEEHASHALVVGGTGMLRGVSLGLAQPGRVVSVLARHPRRLEALQREAEVRGGQIQPITLDYRDTQSLIESLADARRRWGPFDLGVVWIHSTAPEAPLAVASVLSRPARPCTYFHVLSSAVADPSRTGLGWRSQFVAFPGIEYHEILLGFVRGHRSSRWLYHEEICTGVLGAIEHRLPRTIVGMITPWSARP